MKQPEYLRSTKALTPLLNTDAFYISTEKDPPSPLAGSFSCRQPPAVSSQQLAVSRQQLAVSRPPPALWASPTHKAAGRVCFAACHLRTAACAHFHRLHAISQGPSQRAARFRIGAVFPASPPGTDQRVGQGARTDSRGWRPAGFLLKSNLSVSCADSSPSRGAGPRTTSRGPRTTNHEPRVPNP